MKARGYCWPFAVAIGFIACGVSNLPSAHQDSAGVILFCEQDGRLRFAGAETYIALPATMTP